MPDGVQARWWDVIVVLTNGSQRRLIRLSSADDAMTICDRVTAELRLDTWAP